MRISDWSSDVCSSDLLTIVASIMPPRTAGSLRKRRAKTMARSWVRSPISANALASRAMSNASMTGPSALHVPIRGDRSEEHTSELQSLMRISYAVFCLKKKTLHQKHHTPHIHQSLHIYT